jgi:hypothetical protein
VRLSPAKFNGFLSGAVGQSFMWRRRSACPCLSRTSGQNNGECLVCDGKGNIWAAEVPGMAGMTNQTPQKAIAIFGTWEPGDCVLTIPQSSVIYGAGRYDLIRAVNSTNPFSEVVQPGLNDRVKGTIESLSRVFWIDPADGRTIVDGELPAVADDGSLTWPDGAPPEGVQFTLEGVRYDEFFVFNSLSSDRNSGVTGLPMKLAARVFDLMGR